MSSTEAASGEPQRFVAFRVGDTQVLSPLDRILEIVQPIKIHPVPQTRPWFLGLTSRNGELLPVTDLSRYASTGSAETSATARILIVDYQGEKLGLMVDEVRGLVPADASAETCTVDNALLDQLSIGASRFESETYPVIDVNLLLEQPSFLHVGADA